MHPERVQGPVRHTVTVLALGPGRPHAYGMPKSL
jgi:hypothetical protein